MTMKLTKREKLLIGLLILVMVSFLLYKFVIQPQRESLKTLESDRSVKLQQLSQLKEEIASESKLYVELLSLEDDINNKADHFFTKVTQADIILLMEEMTNTAKLKVPDIDFPESRIEEVILPDPEAEAEAEKEAVQGQEGEDEEEVEEAPAEVEEGEEEPPKVDLKVHSADLKYEGYYYAFLDFLKEISEYDKKIIVKDIKVSKDEDGYLRGNILLDFYSIENIIPDGEEMYAWGPNLGYVVGDPFSEFGDYAAQKQAKENQAKSQEKTEEKDDPNSNIMESLKDMFVSSGDSGTGTDTSTETIERGKTVIDFDKKDGMFFVGNNKDIKGSLSIDKKKIQGTGSLNMKYDFVEKRQHNMANISFNNNVLIKEQPNTLTLSVNPVEKSQATIGVIIRDREGIDYKLELSDNLNWNGWDTIAVDLPVDINYPAIIERIYVETEDFHEKLTGNLLIDDLKLIYD